MPGNTSRRQKRTSPWPRIPTSFRSDVPWLCDVARLSYPASTADKTCATLNSWTGSTGKQPDAQLAADILKADHDQSNLAHQQTVACATCSTS